MTTEHDLPDNPREAARALAAEAARLVASLRESVEAAQREVDQEADGRAAGDPLASSCRACPVCQLLDVVKLLRPDVVANLGTIVSELADSAREMLAAMPSSASAGSTTPPSSPVPDAARGASGRASGAESGAPSEPEARSLPDDAADVVEIPVAERITIT
ncbi:MAG: hypothetical protein IPJ14_18200 [Kineosporiaceae bacterium]|nr:hypothetical protein [Kineosporiaceae bacterium]